MAATNAIAPGKAAPAPETSAAPVSATDLSRLLKGPLVFGLVVTFLFFGVLGAWSAVAPLASGAIASGVVSPDSNRRVIQHLEGGIIEHVHVREGQRVSKGDTLVTLQETRAAATFGSRREQWLRLVVVRARLGALSAGHEEISLPPEVSEEGGGALSDYIETQRDLFDVRRASLAQQLQIHERQIEQLESEIESLRAENQGLARQMELVVEEVGAKSDLLAQQLIGRSEVLSLEREQARLMSAVAANEARIAQAGQSIEEVRLQLLQTESKFRDEIAQESTQVNNDLAQLEEDMISTRDTLDRTRIVSPVDGVVLNIRSQTIGGVIRGGDPIMDIVPLDDDLVILARLAPKDVDVVQVGLVAQVSLVPFASRNMLPLKGEVAQVAADSKVDEATGHSYYEIRVRVPSAELAKHEGIYLSPGMPADVTVVTGERTMLQYLLDPFLRSLQSAFVYD